MNKTLKQNILTLNNLERSLIYAINSNKGRQYQFKVIHAALKRANKIISKRKEVKPKQAKQCTTTNPKHIFILKLLKIGLNPVEIINIKVIDCKSGFVQSRGIWKELPKNLKQCLQNKSPNDYLLQSNLAKKYNVRTIQEIRRKYVYS